MPVGKCQCGRVTVQTKYPGGIFGKHLQCHCSHCRKWCEIGVHEGCINMEPHPEAQAIRAAPESGTVVE